MCAYVLIIINIFSKSIAPCSCVKIVPPGPGRIQCTRFRCHLIRTYLHQSILSHLTVTFLFIFNQTSYWWEYIILYLKYIAPLSCLSCVTIGAPCSGRIQIERRTRLSIQLHHCSFKLRKSLHIAYFTLRIIIYTLLCNFTCRSFKKLL